MEESANALHLMHPSDIGYMQEPLLVKCKIEGVHGIRP